MNAPVTVFERGGKQYVVAYSAGNLFAASVKGDSVWLFRSMARSIRCRLPARLCC